MSTEARDERREANSRAIKLLIWRIENLGAEDALAFCRRCLDDRPELKKSAERYFNGCPLESSNPLTVILAHGIADEARHGEWRALTEWLRRHGDMCPELYEVLVDILCGKLKRSRGRRRGGFKKLDTRVRDQHIAAEIAGLKAEDLRRGRKKRALAEIADKFGVKMRTVYKAQTKWRRSGGLVGIDVA